MKGETTVALMKIALVLMVLLALFGPPSFGGVTKTPRTGKVELRERLTSTMLGQYDTLEACIAAIPPPTKTGKVEYNCKAVTYIDVEGNCDGVAKPALATFTVLDDEAVIYAGPYCAPGETCTTPPGWNDRSFTYTDVGGLRFDVVDGKLKTEEYALKAAPFPACWQWQWGDVTVDVTPVAEYDGFIPELDPGALDGEKDQ